MKSNIKQLVEDNKTNAHLVSQQAGLTYRVVLALCKAEKIKPTTPIGTLQKIGEVLGVRVDQLYTLYGNDKA